MKEIKEKIKELRNKPYSEYERLSHNKAIDDILRLIEEEENKPFNPLDFDFRVYNGDVTDYRKTFIKEIKPCVYIWLNQYGTENYYYSLSKTPSNIAPCMMDNARINSNFEAKIILKSLRVIE